MNSSIAVEPEQVSEGLQSPQLSVSEGVLIIGMLAGEIPSPYTYATFGEGGRVLAIDDKTFELLQEQFSLSEMEILDLRDDYRQTKNGRCRVRATLQCSRERQAQEK